MARHWAVGPVKTRLAASIGQDRAREIYRAMVESLWAGIANPLLERHLWATPENHGESCEEWLQGASHAFLQPEGDLGARMSAAFEQARSCPWAAVIGTDCPALDAQVILEAGAALDHVDVSLIPTFDGGYALMALRQPQPGLFLDMPWSTEAVLPRTLERAESLGLKVALGPPLRDLDNLEDLQILQSEGLIPRA